jgi:cytochrome P450
MPTTSDDTDTSIPVAFTPWDPAIQRDPYAQLRELQRRDPVHWFGLVSAWVLTAHADVAAVLADERFSSRTELATFERDRMVSFGGAELDAVVAAFFAHSLLFLDDPDHARLRDLVRPFFSRAGVAALEERIVRLVDETLDALPDEGEVDAVAAFASVLPGLVAGELLGVPRAQQKRLRRCAEGIGIFFDIIKSDDDRAHAARCLAELWGTLADLAWGGGAPEGSVVEALARACDRGDVTRDEMLATCCLLASAGHESTGNLIGNALLALAAAPELAAALAAHPERIAGFVEEVLRTDGPVVGVQRVATTETELQGRTIRPGDYVIAITAAANRDPAEYARPDVLDPEAPRPHLAFGHGRHFCVGARLARAEATIALTRWLATFELTLARPVDALPRKPTQVLRGPAEVWLRVRRRARAAARR